ncbi:MAG: hypothetical protein ABIM89_00515 [Mycobacteriales bacterium]
MDTPPADELLLVELHTALAGHDVVPDSVTEAARAAFAWRTVDAELAALSYDSFTDDQELAGVRSAASVVRMLTFESAELTIEVAVERGRLMGQLVPPQTGRVEVRHTGGSVSLEADDLGRFTCNDLPRGPVSLHCVTESDQRIYTDWTIL